MTRAFARRLRVTAVVVITTVGSIALHSASDATAAQAG